MRAAIYARVSTANNGQDPRMQTRELGEFCERRGWALVEYVDIGISGAKERRPELDRLMADAHKRRFDVVVVWKFDRFARSVSHLLRALETFQALGIEFVSLTEGVDTSKPADMSPLQKLRPVGRGSASAAHVDGVALCEYPQRMTKRRKAKLQLPRLIAQGSLRHWRGRTYWHSAN